MTTEHLLMLAAVLVPAALWATDQMLGPPKPARAARLRIASSGAVWVCCVSALCGAGPVSVALGVGIGAWVHVGLDRDETRTARQFWGDIWIDLWNAWR